MKPKSKTVPNAQHSRPYRANFLYPAIKGSAAEAGYEFANGFNEEYVKEWWDILVERIEANAIKNNLSP